MNKLSTLLLVATIFAVNTHTSLKASMAVQKPAVVPEPYPTGMVTKPHPRPEPWEEINPVITKNYFDKKMTEYNKKIGEKPDAERPELYTILNKIKANHDFIMAEYQKIDLKKIKNTRKENKGLMKELGKKLRGGNTYHDEEGVIPPYEEIIPPYEEVIPSHTDKMIMKK